MVFQIKTKTIMISGSMDGRLTFFNNSSSSSKNNNKAANATTILTRVIS